MTVSKARKAQIQAGPYVTYKQFICVVGWAQKNHLKIDLGLVGRSTTGP